MLIKYMKKIKKNHFFYIFLMLMTLVFCDVKNAQAGMWGESIASEIMHEAWAQLRDEFEGNMLGQMKKLAISEIGGLLKGKSQPYLIEDYNDELSGKVNYDTKLFMDNYFDNIEKEDADSGFSSDGFIANSRIMIKEAVAGEVYGEVDNSSNIEKFIDGDVTKNLFNPTKEKGGGLDFLPMALSDNNNTAGMYLKSLSVASTAKDSIKEAKKTEAIAGNGYRGNGNMAGSTYAAMAAAGEGSIFKRDLIVNANNMTELASITGSTLVADSIGDFNSQMAGIQKNGMKQAKDMAKTQLKHAWRGAYQGAAKGAAIGATVGFITGGPAGAVIMGTQGAITGSVLGGVDGLTN